MVSRSPDTSRTSRWNRPAAREGATLPSAREDHWVAPATRVVSSDDEVAASTGQSPVNRMTVPITRRVTFDGVAEETAPLSR